MIYRWYVTTELTRFLHIFISLLLFSRSPLWKYKVWLNCYALCCCCCFLKKGIFSCVFLSNDLFFPFSFSNLLAGAPYVFSLSQEIKCEDLFILFGMSSYFYSTFSPFFSFFCYIIFSILILLCIISLKFFTLLQLLTRHIYNTPLNGSRTFIFLRP